MAKQHPTRANTSTERAFEDKIVGLMAGSAEILGIPRSVASIYGIIFASPRPLSSPEIQDRLSISSGSVSQGLKFLKQLGAITVVTVDDGRRDHYEPQLELRRFLMHLLERRFEPQLQNAAKVLKELEAENPFSDAVESAEMTRRLAYLQSWDRKALAAIPVARTLLRTGII